MPTTKRDGLPAFWTTHIAKVLVGEQPCYLAPWLSGHYKLEKSTRDQGSMALWKANHTELLNKVIEKYRADGWKCSVEKFFRVTGQTAVISGKADLIAQQTDHRPVIVDAKSGAEKESDAAQVMIEMILIPLAWNAPAMIFDGIVDYGTYQVKVTPGQAAEMKPKLFALLKKLATMERPAASPSESACRFCEVPESKCPDRWKDDMAPAATEEF